MYLRVFKDQSYYCVISNLSCNIYDHIIYSTVCYDIIYTSTQYIFLYVTTVHDNIQLTRIM